MANVRLRKFYGLDSSSDPPNEAQKRDLDSPYFEPHTFFEECVNRDSLKTLRMRENLLTSDIQQYDSELQTLVYDNYSKFLGASDTVRTLGTSISTLNDKMTNLETNITGVAQDSDEIEKDLAPNRQKIQRLMGISRLLERVDFISKLPQQLSACLKAKKYSTAVNVWTKVEGILTTQQHFPSFRRIHEECKSIMKEIWERVRAHMLNMDVSVNESIECAVLLVKLNTPLTTVCSQLVHHWFLVIDNSLEYGEIEEEPFTALSSLKRMAIDDASAFMKLYKDKLLVLETREVAKVTTILTGFMEKIYDRISVLLPIKTLFNLDCRKIAAYLSGCSDLLATIATDEQISRYVRKVLEQYTAAKAVRIIDDLTIEARMKHGMELYEYLTVEFMKACNNLISEFRALTMMEFREGSEFLVRQISPLFDNLFNFFRTGEPNDSLVFSVVASGFIEREIPHVFGQLSTLEHESPLGIFQERAYEGCRETVTICLSRFVNYQRREFDSLIKTAIQKTDWTSTSDPETVSPKISEFTERIVTFHDSVSKLLALIKGDTVSTASDTANWQKRSILKSSFYTDITPTFCGVRDDGIHQIDRLFTSVNRLHLSRPLDFDTQSIVTSVILYSMKTILELVRLEKFSNQGFNQIQIDCYALYYTLGGKIEQREQLAALIEEIISSASDRTIDPVPLDIDQLKTFIEEPQTTQPEAQELSHE